MLKYILILILIIGAFFGLNKLFIILMNKYGPGLARRFGTTERKKKEIQINQNCLIIAFILFVIVMMPATNNVVFFFMALLFAVRAFYGKLTIGRGISLFFGSFLAGIVIGGLIIRTINVAALLVLSFVAIPLVIFGFLRRKKVN